MKIKKTDEIKYHNVMLRFSYSIRMKIEEEMFTNKLLQTSILF